MTKSLASIVIFLKFRNQIQSICTIDAPPKLLVPPISQSTETIKMIDHQNNRKLFHFKTPYFSVDTIQSTNQYVKRPDTLTLNSNNQIHLAAAAVPGKESDFCKNQKFLYRSNSSRTFKRPKQKLNLGYEFDQIYFISSNKDDEHYDSIDVIDERRRKNFNKFDLTEVESNDRSTSAIYSEYCSLEQNDGHEICFESMKIEKNINKNNDIDQSNKATVISDGIDEKDPNNAIKHL